MRSKRHALLALAAVLCVGAVFTPLCRAQATVSCGANPVLSDIADYIQNVGNYYADARSDLDAYMLQATPQEQPSLSICAQFQKSSCCTPQFETTLSNLSYAHYWQYKNQEFYFIKFVKNFVSAIRVCSNNGNIKEPSGQNITTFDSVYTSFKESVLRIIRANVRLIRGNLCILCAPPSAYSSDAAVPLVSLSTGTTRLRVSNSDLDLYVNDVTRELNELMKMKSDMKQGLLDYYNLVADPTNCGGVLEKTFDFINDLNLCPGGSCENHVRNRVGLFIQTLEDELVNIVQPDLSATVAQSTRAQLSNPRTRKLSASTYYISAQQNFLSTYISLPAVDEKLQYMGVYDGNVIAAGERLVAGVAVLVLAVLLL